MLERFKVPEKDRVYVPDSSLRETAAAIFEKMGLTSADAAIGADVLVTADLRGVETHGVSNKMRDYVGFYNEGSVNPRPVWRVVRETRGTAVIDGDRGLGIVLGPDAMGIAVDKARDVGVGVVTVRNSSHLGPVGHFAMLAAQKDMIGVCATATGGGTLPTFGAEPRLGTNPISIAAPAGTEAPVLFDAATSAVAGNKLGLARRVGVPLLPGWIADTDGNPIMEESPVPEKGQFHRLHFGGTRELGSHKGYGLGMMVEVLATFLAGALPGMLESSDMNKHYFAAYDIAAFTDVDTFKDNMDRMLETLRTTRPAPGHDRVIYPGLSEYEETQERRANGIPLHREVVEWFDDIAGELSITPLRRM